MKKNDLACSIVDFPMILEGNKVLFFLIPGTVNISGSSLLRVTTIFSLEKWQIRKNTTTWDQTVCEMRKVLCAVQPCLSGIKQLWDADPK